MTKTQRLRMTLDIAMTLLSVALMGGTMLFPSDKAHQILGMALLAAASGVMMAWFMPASFALGFARTAHLVGTHWYYLFLCAHFGMHFGQIASRLGTGRGGQKKTLALRIALALACVYGAYAFVRRGVWQYLFLRQQFFFLDLEHGYVLFAADYVAILVLFSAVAHYAGKLLARTKRAKNGNDATA